MSAPQSFVKSPSSIWSVFMQGLHSEIATDCKINTYRIDDVIPCLGEFPRGLERDSKMLRLESKTPITLQEQSAFWCGGVTQHLNYTGADQSKELLAISRTELPASEDTTAVLIPIAKSVEWWQMAQDRRQAFFLPSEKSRGHTAIGLAYADRIFRRLYHSRFTQPLSPYDFLTYFEFNRSQTADFKKLLAELRNPHVNPEWSYVQSEYEIWMTKLE